MSSSKRRVARLSKRILSSSVRDGGGVSICGAVVKGLVEVGVVVSAVVSIVVVLRVGVIGFGGAALSLVVSVFLGSGFFGSATFLCGLFSLSGVVGLFLLSRSHERFSLAGVDEFSGW